MSHQKPFQVAVTFGNGAFHNDFFTRYVRRERQDGPPLQRIHFPVDTRQQAAGQAFFVGTGRCIFGSFGQKTVAVNGGSGKQRSPDPLVRFVFGAQRRLIERSPDGFGRR